MMSVVKGSVRLLAVAVCIVPALAQQCPRSTDKNPYVESEVRTLEGQLIFHDAIRKWFELKLDQPECGQASIELLSFNDQRKQIETLRGCRVRSKGSLGIAMTGYYSLDVNQGVKEIEPLGACARQALLPDYSNARPDKAIRTYRVDMAMDYDPLHHPINFRVTSAGKELQPWQAYASHTLTGGFVLYGHCAEGFMVDKVFGTAEASPSHFTERGDSGDMAMFDPESAAASGKKDLHLSYTCVHKK
jgi:hypothetical protein